MQPKNKDNLIQLMQRPLTDEQKDIIDLNRRKLNKGEIKRSELAKKAGTSKLQLNFYLGGGDSAS